MTILIVEDDLEVASVLTELLAAEGHEVEIATNGILALEKSMDGAYDVILTDVKMPQLDGAGFYRELERRRPELCRRVVFATGDGLSPTTRSFLDQVGARTLNKPFNLDEVRRVIRQTPGSA